MLARNHRTRRGEIDLVAFGAGTLAFVEVKTHRMPRGGNSGGELGWPAAAQRRRLRRLALDWLREARPPAPYAREIRLDAVRVSVGAQGELLALVHLANAF